MRTKLRQLKSKCELRHKKLDQDLHNINSNFKEIARSFNHQRDWESVIEAKFDNLMKMIAQLFEWIKETGACVRNFCYIEEIFLISI